ncbi:SCAN domain-containing protein 3 [Eumeta japonica]|uniref:SCAN domain-containing protein 3 n=1 Tax=Eumeta variegata TaxID=151549 RepID=A0A4C1TV57_EUMVA|nr:SCAN domain-containing protein 3 [Eumeta japonica]
MSLKYFGLLQLPSSLATIMASTQNGFHEKKDVLENGCQENGVSSKGAIKVKKARSFHEMSMSLTLVLNAGKNERRVLVIYTGGTIGMVKNNEGEADKQLPMCLLCNKLLSNDSMKPSKLEDHLKRCHTDKIGKDLKYFQTLKEKYEKRPTMHSMFASTSQSNDDGLRASYNISLLIAKSGKPHTIGEQLILPAVEEVLKTVLHKSPFDVLKRIPLSNNTVKRRVDEMSSDIESFLCNHLQKTHFSIQLDESSLPGNEALLLAYVRFIMEEEIHEELLFARTLETDTKGESIFNVLSNFFTEKSIPFTNIISVATDGVPAMVGRYRGFISHLKRIIPGLTAIHCVIHRQHLVVKHLSERLNQSVHFVIKAVNKIRSNALNTRLFAQLCDGNDEDFQRLLLHTEVRWLLKGACLTRFYSVFDSVLEFLESRDPDLKENLIKFKAGIAYLTDLFKKFNDINLQLQGDSLNLIKTKGIISAFLGKLKFMKQNISRREFSQFPNLSQTMDILPWIINPFDETEVANVVLQEELLELSTNEELKVKFRKGYQTFWLQAEIPEKYPGLWEIARKFLIAFPSSYLVERSFSAVTNLLTKKEQIKHHRAGGFATGVFENLVRNFTQLHDVMGWKQKLRDTTFDASYLVLPDAKDIEMKIFYKILEYDKLLDSSNMTDEEWIRIAKDIMVISDAAVITLVSHFHRAVSFKSHLRRDLNRVDLDQGRIDFNCSKIRNKENTHFVPGSVRIWRFACLNRGPVRLLRGTWVCKGWVSEHAQSGFDRFWAYTSVPSWKWRTWFYPVALYGSACTLAIIGYQGLIMEPEGQHRNSLMKQRILAVFGLVEIVLRCTLTMNDFRGLMMQPEGSDNEAGSLEAPSLVPDSQSSL